MRVVPAIIIATGFVLAPVIYFAIQYFVFGEEDFQGPVVDSGARIEIEMMRGVVDDLNARIQELENEIARMPVSGGGSGGVASSNTDDEDAYLRDSGPNDIIDAYAQVVLIANRRDVNNGLKVAGPSYLEKMLGRPGGELSDDCGSVTNEYFKENLVLEQVGPIRVRMLQPAVESLRNVFRTIERADPDLYARINTSGALCVRRIRGSENRLSTHSFGLALDLNIDGRLDTLGDGKTQLGLTILADFFHEEGWVWGASFGREDSMHFEVSRKMLDEWLAEGRL